MKEKLKQVWGEIEEAIGGCCLHKKAAYYEVSGGEVQQLTLVTTASKDMIEAFIGDREVERIQKNRYSFTHNGVSVDLTTYENEENLDELYRKAFQHLLTIDSLGVRRDGKVSNAYGGLEDMRTKTVRLTGQNAPITDVLYRRILLLVINEGYHLDESVQRKLEADKLLEKENYRRKFCELLIGAVKGKAKSWNNVAELVGTLGSALGHRKAITEYTRSINKPFEDTRFRRSFLYLIFALIKVTGKELSDLMSGDEMLDYYDSLCANLQKQVKTGGEYRALKDKYGKDFMEALFDMQELWMAMENIPYKRPSERDFDRMSLIIADESHWVSPNAPEQEKDTTSATEDDDEDVYHLEGTLDFARTMDSVYNEEDYEEPMEGTEEDSYVTEEVDIPEQKAELKVKDATAVSGLDTFGLEAYEAQMKGEPHVNPPKEKKPEGFLSSHKGHSGKMLGK